MNKQLTKKLDIAFSKMIRKRDDKGGFFICCSCGQIKPSEQADAGHFINRKWVSVRWHEQNVHSQCRACNRFDEGNASGYALFMINKYGKERVEFLQALSRQTAKYSDFDGELMLKDFKNRLK